MSPHYAHRMMTPGAALHSPGRYATRSEALPELHSALLNVCARGCRVGDLTEAVSSHLRHPVHVAEAREAVESLVAGQLLREGSVRECGRELQAYVSTEAGLRALGRRS